MPHPTSWKSMLLLYILQCIPGSPRWSLSLTFPHQNPLYTLPLPHKYHMPSHLTLSNLITWIIFGEQYGSLSSSLCSFLHAPVTLPFLDPYIPLQLPILKQPQPTFLSQCEQPSFTPIQNRQNYSFYSLIFIFLDSKLEDKTFCTKYLPEKRSHFSAIISMTAA